MAFTQKEIEAIKKAVETAVDTKFSGNICKEADEGCPIGFSGKHVKALDDLTDMLENSRKTVRDTIQNLIKWALIIGFLTLLGDKAKDILFKIINLGN